jgi:hypothetical protein
MKGRILDAMQFALVLCRFEDHGLYSFRAAESLNDCDREKADA